MIELGNGTYISRFFYVEGPECNIMGALQRKSAEWSLVWRFRHYKDNLIFDSTDTRNWYELQVHDEQDGIEKLKTVLNGLLSIRGFYGVDGSEEADVLIVESEDPQVCLDKMASRPWVNIQVRNGQGTN